MLVGNLWIPETYDVASDFGEHQTDHFFEKLRSTLFVFMENRSTWKSNSQEVL